VEQAMPAECRDSGYLEASRGPLHDATRGRDIKNAATAFMF